MQWEWWGPKHVRCANGASMASFRQPQLFIKRLFLI